MQKSRERRRVGSVDRGPDAELKGSYDKHRDKHRDKQTEREPALRDVAEGNRPDSLSLSLSLMNCIALASIAVTEHEGVIDLPSIIITEHENIATTE